MTHSGFGAGFQKLVTGCQQVDETTQLVDEISLPGKIVGTSVLKAVFETLAEKGCKFWVAKTEAIAEQIPDAIESWKAVAYAEAGMHIVIADYEKNLPLIVRRVKEREQFAEWVYDIEAM